METPIIVIRGCAEHCTVVDNQIRVVTSGPGSSEASQDFISDTMMCWKCWELDEPVLLALCAALNMPPEETVELRLAVMRRKIEANRN